MTGSHVLVVGTGSVGKRHARNLLGLGCEVTCVDPRRDRLEEALEELGAVPVYPDLEAAFASGQRFDGVAVASPPAFHVEQCLAALHRGVPVLLEKPVSPDLASAARLQEAVHATSVPLLLGYTYRWWEPLFEVRRLLADEAVGELRYVRFDMSAHLADWHPWERYQDFFMSSAALGGGALLDESHWIDLMIWFFGMPESLVARVEKVSGLEIDADDMVDVLVHYPDGPRVSIHLDLIGRPHEKSIRFVGEGGSIHWSIDPNRVAVARGPAQDWLDTDYDCERNDMFMGVAREFLQVIAGQPARTCTVDDGVRVLSIVEAARESHASGRRIRCG